MSNESNKNLVLIFINGQDHPGVTAGLMKCIHSNNATIEDMGQSITHGFLSLNILLSVKDQDVEDSPLLKDLFFTAKKMKMQLEFELVTDPRLIKKTGDKYIISVVNQNGLKADFLEDISRTLAQNNVNIQRIDNITEDEFKSLDIATTAQTENIDWTEIKKELINISNQHSTDLAMLKDDVWRWNKRLIVFDMDSTLIQSEVIVEMAKVHGVGDEVHRITEEAMNGKFDFSESLEKRVSLLKGLSEDKLQGILQNIKLTDGVDDFIRTVKGLGYKVAIISGGFQYFANHFKDTLNLDYAFANDLEIIDGTITGRVQGSIVDAEKKALLLEMLAQQEGIKLEQVVAIGDGANDLKMLAKAGLGIAFHAKDIVKENAGQHMSHGPMTSILYFLGIPGTQG
jgi:phosphoserine phosphatase